MRSRIGRPSCLARLYSVLTRPSHEIIFGDVGFASTNNGSVWEGVVEQSLRPTTLYTNVRSVAITFAHIAGNHFTKQNLWHAFLQSGTYQWQHHCTEGPLVELFLSKLQKLSNMNMFQGIIL